MELSFSRDATSIVLDGVVKGPSGKRRITMVLDTGASITMIPSKVLTKIGYSPLKSEKMIKVHSANGPIDVNTTKIEEIDVFGAKVRDIEVICHDLPPESHIEGLIGLNFLKHFKMTLDWPNGRLTIE